MTALLWVIAWPLRTLLSSSALVWVLVVLAVIAAAQELLPGTRTLPTSHRQVPQHWLSEVGPKRAYLRYGAILGAGLLTFIPYTSTHVILLGSGVVLSLNAAAIAGLAFGVGRTVLVGPIAFAQRAQNPLSLVLGKVYRRGAFVSAGISALVVALLVGCSVRGGCP